MDFDEWKENPYTKVLEASIASDYVPRTDLAAANERIRVLDDEIERNRAAIAELVFLLRVCMDEDSTEHGIGVDTILLCAEAITKHTPTTTTKGSN